MNKPFRKIITLILILLILISTFSGCKNEPSSEQKNDKIVYSNIVSEKVQNDLMKILTDSSITTERQNVLFDHIKQFNSIVNSKNLVSDFEEYDAKKTKYDPYDMQDEWNEKSPDFMGYNCRITAFGIYRDFLEIPQNSDVNNEMILFDLSALSEDSSVLLKKNDENAFSIFYSVVPTTLTKDIDTHVATLQESWKNRGIKFAKNEKASLISVIFNESMDKNDNYLFVGHTGVLFESNNKLYFLEKIAFQEPYQLTRFNNRSELNDYLMKKYDVSYDQPTVSPYIMENDQLLQDYKRITD